ncbi:uncharacterized protein LOC122651021 [Telopea speciosissima]|uniref:uncharacterized protein LOC122651021 n=1 Tax=Telopea speciosissima TaxID=54955 RepID=UPI001CC74E0D|nr:uncharacterized protein LOC122651021 [Telopea speciosissima]
MRGKTKMWLENYETFLENRNENDLSINQLNQIIHMHGFAKVHRHPKDFLANSISTINLLVPFRSTLEMKDTISPCAFHKTEEVMKDLCTLDWQECTVQSVETLSSGKGKHALILDQRTNCTSSTVREIVGKPEVRKKRKVMNVITGEKSLALLALAATPSFAPHIPRRSC